VKRRGKITSGLPSKIQILALSRSLSHTIADPTNTSKLRWVMSILMTFSREAEASHLFRTTQFVDQEAATNTNIQRKNSAILSITLSQVLEEIQISPELKIILLGLSRTTDINGNSHSLNLQ
jgi:hypothetical protein